jgi:RNA polymerase sigma-70 factor (ECF subfamily)
MDGQHPNQHDKRPKRRKDKDNPYELFTVGFGTPEPLYFIRFKDGQEIEHCMEIQKSLFDLLDSFELEDLSFLNERDRHYDLRELSDPQLQEQPCHQNRALPVVSYSAQDIR